MSLFSSLFGGSSKGKQPAPKVSSQTQRRQSSRAHLTVEGDLRHRDGKCVAHMLDISEGGAMLSVNRRMLRGERVVFELFMDSQARAELGIAQEIVSFGFEIIEQAPAFTGTVYRCRTVVDLDPLQRRTVEYLLAQARFRTVPLPGEGQRPPDAMAA